MLGLKSGMKLCLLNTVILLFCCNLAKGQVYFLDEHFNSAPAVPAGLTGSGGAFSSVSGTSNYGRNSPAIEFVNNGQILQYGPWASAADQISFFHKALTGGGSTLLVQESADGLSWTIVTTVNTITTAATCAASLLSSSRYIRITLTLVPACYVIVDDLRIRKLTALCDAPVKILQLLINGSCASCEGSNEFVYFQTGGNPLDVRYMELVSQTVSAGGCAYGGNGSGDNLNTNWVLSGAYSVLQNNYIANLNLWAGCPGVFVPVPPGNVIPSDSKVIAFTGATPDATYNFGSICSVGTIYVVFANQVHCGGKYANSSCALNCTRYLTLFNHLTGCVDNEQYMANSVNTTAGNGYIFAGSNIGYTSTATCTFLVLSSKLKSFIGHQNVSGIDLEWTTLMEENMNDYDVERSSDGKNFQAIAKVNSINAQAEWSYTFIDNSPEIGRNYYRLKMNDWNNNEEFSQVIEVNFLESHAPFSVIISKDNVLLKSNSDMVGQRVSICNTSGQLLFDKIMTLQANSYEIISGDLFPFGLYFLFVGGDVPFVTKFVKD